ncbi:MAG: MBOAT family protein [Clostridia bacterium]|nr:MBOAT family protein [Clostridia bacterium]
MLFSSLTFLFGFLPAVLLINYIIPKKYITLKNLFLFLASLVFYAWGEPKFVFVMLLSITVNYIFGLLIHRYRESAIASKCILILTVLFNLAIIFLFKYLIFFLTNINAAFGTNFTLPSIHLPIGISFFTFQAISYVIDIYRKHGDVQKNILNVGLYIAFFPQLVAGPIVRYETISEQIQHRSETFENFSQGVLRFIAGLTKKVLISNQMALIADAAFNQLSPLSVAFAWLGAIAYMFQIYYDFSGYSDMAIGLGKMFGFQFDENFNYPYISKNITEFWRRWHISLSTWFRDYVYIPLGGSRTSKPRLVLNLFVVWLLTGIWHGASWNFIVWGLYFFLFLVIEKLFFIKRFKDSALKTILSNTLGRIYSVAVVLFGWVLFRAETLTSAITYLKNMFFAANLTDNTFLQYIQQKKIFLLAALLFSTPVCQKITSYVKQKNNKLLTVITDISSTVIYLLLFFVSVSYLIKGTYNPFIYFNF